MNLDILDLAGNWKKISDSEPVIGLIEKIVKKIHKGNPKKINLI